MQHMLSEKYRRIFHGLI